MLLQEEKLTAVIHKNKTVVAVSKELGVSRQTIHKWLSRYKRFGAPGLVVRRKQRRARASNKTPAKIERRVIKLARDYWQDGVQTLADRLQYEQGVILHPVTIYRILKRNDIRYTGDSQYTKKRWKKKLYAHKIPGRELQMDTKYPFGYKQGKVIYTIIDDATRWVYAKSYKTADASSTVDFLGHVLIRAPFTIQKIRTDQGREFIATKVKDLLQQHRISYRNNTPYCPEENGKIERFHRTLNEKALRFGFSPNKSLDDMQYKLNLFLHYYNYQKKHRGLGMDGLTPIQKLTEYGSVNLTLQCYNT